MRMRLAVLAGLGSTLVGGALLTVVAVLRGREHLEEGLLLAGAAAVALGVAVMLLVAIELLRRAQTHLRKLRANAQHTGRRTQQIIDLVPTPEDLRELNRSVVDIQVDNQALAEVVTETALAAREAGEAARDGVRAHTESIGRLAGRVDRLGEGVDRLEANVDRTAEVVRSELDRAVASGGAAQRMVRGETTGLYGQLEGLHQLRDHIRLDRPPAPLGGWALRADLAAHLLRTVIAERPQSVVELGSGRSTVLLAAMLRDLGVGHVAALEHDEGFASETRRLLADQDLQDWATVFVAPLVPIEIGGESFSWYDLDEVRLPETIDLMVVDGPPADSGPLARYPAVPLLQDRFASGARVYLDDGNRPDEQRIAERWTELLDGVERHDLPHLVGTIELCLP